MTHFQQSQQSQHSRYSRLADDAADPVGSRVERLLHYLLAIGTVLIVLVPAARGSHAVVGFLPMWLLGMPLMAWWALHRCVLPRRPRGFTTAAPRPTRRRSGEQARRRARPRRVQDQRHSHAVPD